MINGRRDQLEGKLQQRYGYGKDRIKSEIDDWASRVRTTARRSASDADLSDELDAIIGAHLIDTKALRHADFEAFFLARRRALLGLVEQATGKRAQQDVDAGALTGGEEAPEAFADEADDPESSDEFVPVISS